MYKYEYRRRSIRLGGYDYGQAGYYLPAGRQAMSRFASKTNNGHLAGLKMTR